MITTHYLVVLAFLFGAVVAVPLAIEAFTSFFLMVIRLATGR